MENVGVRRFFAERLFARTVREHCHEALSSMNYALRLRESVLQSFDHLSAMDIENAFALNDLRTIADHVGRVVQNESGKETGLTIDEGDALFEKEIRLFTELTGWDGSRSDGFLPISVYDSRFLGAENIMAAFAAGEGEVLVADADLTRLGLTPEAVYRHAVPVRWNGGSGLVGTAADRSGYNLFSSYMSNSSSKRSLESFLEKSSEEGQGLSPSGLSRARYLCEFLSDSGYRFDLEPGYRSGQVIARVENGMDVRIGESARFENFIGSVFHSGYDFRVGTTVRSSSGTQYFHLPSHEQSLDVFRLASGQPLRAFTSNISDEYLSNSGALRGTYRSRNGLVKGLSRLQNRNSEHRLVVRTERMRGVAPLWLEEEGRACTWLKNQRNQIAESESFFDRICGRFVSYRDNLNSDDEEMIDSFVSDIAEGYHAVGDQRWKLPDVLPIVNNVPAQRLGDIVTGAHLAAVFGVGERWSVEDIDEHIRTQISLLSVDDIRTKIDEALSATRSMWTNVLTIDNQSVTVSHTGALIEAIDSDLSFWGKREQLRHVLEEARDVDGMRVYVDDSGVTALGHGLNDDLATLYIEDDSIVMAQSNSDFIHRLGVEVKEVLESCAAINVSDEDIRYCPSTGVIRWKALIPIRQSIRDEKDFKELTGVVGSVFDRGEYGEIRTPHADGTSDVFIPSYRAFLVGDDENVPVSDRIRVKSYEDIAIDSVRSQIVRDVSFPENFNRVGNSSSVTSTIKKQILLTRLEPNYIDELHLDSLSPEERSLRKQVIGLLNRKVVFEGERFARLFDLERFSFDDAFERNMTVMGTLTSQFNASLTGSGKNQGKIRFLREDVNVEAGRIVGGDNFLEQGVSRFDQYNTFDRQQMTGQHLLSARGIAPRVKVASVTLGGWTYDDAIVVSREFAENYSKNSAQSFSAPFSLREGDKLCDLHGNKGVISLIVDRDKDTTHLDEHEKKAVDFFRSNPDLDMVISPFSYISRMNAGAFHEAQTHPLHSLTLPDGNVVDGAIVERDYLVTEMSAEKKTRIYSSLPSTEGAKAGGQLLWAIQSGGGETTRLIQYLYGKDTSEALWNLREYLRICGMDIKDGKLDFVDADNTSVRFNLTQATDSHLEAGLTHSVIDHTRGFVQLPFSLRLHNDIGDRQTNLLWLCDPLLREGFTTGEDMIYRNKWSKSYSRIIDAALKYCRTDDMKEKTWIQGRAQKEYDSLVNEVSRLHLLGKHNVMRDVVMSQRIKDSASCVWTPDPSVRLDCVAIPSSMLSQMNLEPGQTVLVWRNPLLRAGGVRALRVSEKSGGSDHISINPLIDKSFDGDFDGDTVIVVPVKDHDAAREARALFSPLSKHSLRDFSTSKEGGRADLFIRPDMDVSAVYAANVDLKNEYASISCGSDDVASKTLQSHVDKTLLNAYGLAPIRFDSVSSHVESILRGCVDTGAKGNASKLETYQRQLRGDVIDPREVSFATAIKSYGTGIAGTFSQRAVRALRKFNIKAATEVTYPVTQAVLQSKHDANAAIKRFHVINGALKDAWNGALVDQTSTGWTVSLTTNGVPVRPTPHEWVESMYRLYTSEDGLNVNVDKSFLESIARNLTVDGVVRGVGDTEILSRAHLTDRLAYQPTLKLYGQLARDGETLNIDSVLHSQERYRNVSIVEEKLSVPVSPAVQRYTSSLSVYEKLKRNPIPVSDTGVKVSEFEIR